MYTLIIIGALLCYFYGLIVLYIRKKYREKINKELTEFKYKCVKKWEKYGEPITKLPSDEWSERELICLINK